MINRKLSSLIRDPQSILINIILIASAGTRIFHYFYDRSLWLDELYLSTSFSHMTLAEILKGPLDYGQNAPVGFLVLVKGAIKLLGFNGLALRIVPLLTGLIALLYFNRLCSRLLDKTGNIIAITICGFAPALTYHSVEIKQYSTEFLAAVLALYFLTIYKDKYAIKERMLWGVLGAVLICFSFSVIFILAGIIIGQVICYINDEKPKSITNQSVTVMFWTGSFLINYIFFTHTQSVDWVVYFFKTYNNFMPLFPTSIEEFMWFPRNLNLLMDYPLGLNWNFNEITSGKFTILFSAVSLLLLLNGIFILFKADKSLSYVFISAIFLTLVASGLKLYPLVERFWLFLTPIFILLVSNGFQHFRFKHHYLKILVLALVIGSPIFSSLYYLIKPQLFYKHKTSLQKEAFEYLSTHFNVDDGVYIYWNNRHGYNVYKNIDKFNFEAVVGKDFRRCSRNLKEYNLKIDEDIKRFSNKKRIWLIYNNHYLTDIGDYVDEPKWYYQNGRSPTENLCYQFLKIGQPIEVTKFKDVTIILFKL